MASAIVTGKHSPGSTAGREEASAGHYVPSPGVVYPTLTMLQDMALIEEAPAEGARKAYQATEEGRAHLDENAEEVAELFERLDRLGAHRRKAERKAGRGPVKRAVGNLLTALWHRVMTDDLDEETLHRIAEILDEAAQKVERLKPRDA